MNRKLILLLLLSVLRLDVMTSAQPAASGLSLVEQEQGWQFYEDGQPVMFYRTVAQGFNGQYERADYVHPLIGLDGQEITEDFPADHLHHRGIFWTWHQLWIQGQSVGDAWLCRDFIWDVQDVLVLEQTDQTAALEATVLWKSPLWHDGQDAMVNETVTLRVYRRQSDRRMIDFTISLLALQEDTWLGGSDDKKGYGGFTARIATPNDTVFTSAIGNVTPQTTPVFGGPWMNLTGTLSRKPYGVAILQHPDNPLFPEAWILRHEKQFSNMQNPVYPWRYPVLLPIDEPVILQYRMVLHKGIDIAPVWEAYRTSQSPR